MTYCLNRRPPTGELAGSWIRDHICRQPQHHTGPHECTCQYQWQQHATPTA